MTRTPFHIEYNQELSGVSGLLAGIQRPGSFMAAGARQGPLPRVDIDGVGTIAFPLLDVQAEALAMAASASPYGRGKETVCDESVRRNRQLDAAQVHLSGATWEGTLDAILKQDLIAMRFLQQHAPSGADDLHNQLRAALPAHTKKKSHD